MIVVNGNESFEMKVSVLFEGTHNLVFLPPLSPKYPGTDIRAVERAYGRHLKDTRMIVIERREQPPEHYSIDGMASDTAAALREMGIKKAVVLGISQGGMIAEVLAAKYPELVSGLILASTCAKTTPALSDTIRRWASLADAANGDALARDMVLSIFSERLTGRFTDLLTMSLRHLTADELQRFSILARACLDFDCTESLNRIECPAWVTGAEGDAVMGPNTVTELAGLLCADSCVYGKEYGHAVYEEAPDFAQRVCRFAAEVFERNGNE